MIVIGTLILPTPEAEPSLLDFFRISKIDKNTQGLSWGECRCVDNVVDDHVDIINN